MSEKRKLIVLDDEGLTIANQCELIGISRSSYYYEPVSESELNLQLMRMIDEQYMSTPFYGSRRMTMMLKKNNQNINRKKVQRLMRAMGLEAMYPRPKTSIGNKEHYKFPHLLKDFAIDKPNQVWGTDITYIPTEMGYLFLTAVLDLFSRYVLSWKLSDNLESDFCIEALQEALSKGVKPEIFNTDQGVQYTSKAHTGLLQQHGISISMSGKGKCWDNIFVERLWRSLKYEEVYLGNYVNGKDASDGIGRYFNFYNNDRLHQTLDYKTPSMIHYFSNTAINGTDQYVL